MAIITPPIISKPQENVDSYNISTLQYPEDLTSTNGHKIVFFINVPGGSNIATKTPERTVSVPPNRYRSASGVQVDQLKNLYGADAANDATRSDITNKVLSVTKPKRRLTDAISLYVPETLIKSYNVNWNEASSEDMMAGAVVTNVLTGGTKLGNQNRGNLGRGTVDVVAPVAGAAAARILNGMKYAQFASGVSPGNSKAELLFQSVDFNTFSFDYRFAPKSESEAANVLSIIRTFRHHMLPEYFDELNYLYIYPSEFEVRYYIGSEENPFIEHHITAVLRSMTINYNPNGQFMTFDNGMPTHINMSLQFKELGVPTKETSPSDRAGA